MVSQRSSQDDHTVFVYWMGQVQSNIFFENALAPHSSSEEELRLVCELAWAQDLRLRRRQARLPADRRRCELVQAGNLGVHGDIEAQNDETLAFNVWEDFCPSRTKGR